MNFGLPDWDIVKAIAPILGLIASGGAAGIVLLFLAVRTGSKALGIAAVGFIAATSILGWGVQKEREVCEARFRVAEQNFEDLQNEVGQLVGQISARAKVSLTERERVNAEELRSIRVRLSDAPVRSCIATGTDAADDRRLRHDRTGKGDPQG